MVDRLIQLSLEVRARTVVELPCLCDKSVYLGCGGLVRLTLPTVPTRLPT